jgi:uncharacterized protein (DUF2336 family)
MTIVYSLLNKVQEATLSGATKRQVRALTRITDLFLAGATSYSKQQMELFEEVFKILVAAIELKTRTTLASRLARNPDVPAALVRAFAFDENVAVAAPVLSESTALAEADLLTVARTQSLDHLHAIAQRKTIEETIIDILIQRGDSRIVRAVAGNEGAKISVDGFRGLVEWSSKDCELAIGVGQRRDIPRPCFLQLLEMASASVRSKIIAAHPEYSNDVSAAVTDVIDGLNQDIRENSAQHAKARRKVGRRKYWNELGELDIQAAARAQDFERVVAALSILAKCPVEIVERTVLNLNPGAVLVVIKAAECSWATAKSVLLMRVADRRLSKMDLDRARDHFESLEAATAKRVIAFYESRRSSSAGASEINSCATIGQAQVA